MQSESRKTGADYATFDDRLPTVKLTDPEKINLVSTIHRILDSGAISWQTVESAMLDVFGPDRGSAYVANLRSKTPGKRWSRRENVRMIAALYPHVPGDTEDAKADWLVERAAPCFAPERWRDVVFPYVLERIAEYKAAGGTLDRWPEVVRPATPSTTLSLASCWNGANAEQRMMNMLSPHMPDAVFKDYLDWMAGQGANTAHLFLSNLGDGQFSAPGYCIYGSAWSWIVDLDMVGHFKRRIAAIRSVLPRIRLWALADDSKAFSDAARQNFPKYFSDLKTAGLLDGVEELVVGLEIDDYYKDESTVAALVSAARAVFSGPVCTHERPGNANFAHLGDKVYFQIAPGKDAAFVEAEIRRLSASAGKPVNAFELDRQPNRELCLAAIRGGAEGVGNWGGGPLADALPESGDVPAGTIFLHSDVSAWPATAKLSASVSGGQIRMPYDKAKAWPGIDGINANPWVIVNLDGQWYAATFEWLRVGQTSKPVGVLDGSKGDHIKVSPLNRWRPRSGERIGLMVSGLARAQTRNVKERSNVSWVVWP